VTDFLKDRGVMLKEGYIKVDNEGNTGIPGVVAAGNIVTPVSGVITALSTGFTAGLNLHTQLYREKFNEPPLLFPWLPMGDPSRHPLFQ
jgi:thioredoxin reductase